MKKVVINSWYGGFGLSHKATMRYAEIKGITLYPWLNDITKKVYAEHAVIGNDELLHHYCTSPVVDEKYERESYFWVKNIPRDDPALIQVVEEMGEAANGRFAELRIVEIPDDVDFTIEECNGVEWIAEKHKTWC